MNRHLGRTWALEAGGKPLAVTLAIVKVLLIVVAALMGIYLSFVSVEGFPFLLSIEALAILIVGGLGSALGAVLGTIFIVLLPEAIRIFFGLFGSGLEQMLSTGIHEVKSIAYGVVIILALRFEPRGLVGVWRDAKRLWTHWPLRY